MKKLIVIVVLFCAATAQAGTVAGWYGSKDYKAPRVDKNIAVVNSLIAMQREITANVRENCAAADEIANMVGRTTGLAAQSYGQRAQILNNLYPGSQFSCAGRQGIIRTADAQFMFRQGGELFQIVFDRIDGALTHTVAVNSDYFQHRVSDSAGNYVVFSQMTLEGSGTGYFEDLKLPIGASSQSGVNVDGRGISLSVNALVREINRIYDDKRLGLAGELSRGEFAANLLLSQRDREWLLAQIAPANK